MQSEAFELSLLQQSPGFVAFLRGKDLIFEVANAAYYETAGHRELIGKSVRDALPYIARSGLFVILDRVLATGEPFVGKDIALMLQRTPGAPLEEAVVDFIYQPIRGADGTPIGVLVQGYETTEVHRQSRQRARAEEKLRASEERYRTLFDSIDDGFCLMQMLHDATGRTVDYRFLETNAAFEQHTGLVNAVGKTALELVPTLDDSWFQLYGEVADTGVSKRFENHAPAMQRWFDV